MEHLWENPEKDTLKINVFCLMVQQPSAIGNIKSIGALMRDEHGGKVWGAMGPFNNNTEEQAIMAGIQSACIYAQKNNLQLTHIETSHYDVFDLIRLQEHVVIPDDQLDGIRLFNTVHANHFVEGATDRHISWVPDHMNSPARYMAEYALENLPDYVETPGPHVVGNLQFYLDRDMGMVIANPEIELLPNMGLGEVIDGSPPPSNKRKCWECYYDLPCYEYPPISASGRDLVAADGSSLRATKTRAYGGESSVVVLQEQSSGYSLAQSAKGKEVHIANGLFAKDVLHHACMDTLGIISRMLKKPVDKGANIHELEDLPLMSVEKMMTAMDFENDQLSGDGPSDK
ncbi:hypothetical protein ACET3Z_025892 [Daucus carota]